MIPTNFWPFLSRKWNRALWHAPRFFDFEFNSLYRALPDGWFDYDKSKTLYQAASETQGPIMEIGSFVGRSTACICYGIKKSGQKKAFYSVDLHFDSVEAFQTWYEPIHGQNAEPPDLLLKYLKTGGTFRALKHHLSERGLLQHVQLLKGNFEEVMPPQKFSLIFCDAVHNVTEIRRMVPKLLNYATSGTLLICDDCQNETMFQEMQKQARFRDAKVLHGSLFWGHIQDLPS